MRFITFLSVILISAFFAFGQELPVNPDSDTSKVLGVLPADSSKTKIKEVPKPEILVENMKEKVNNPRYIIVSAVMMMVFAGLCMGSVSAINPD